MQKKNSNQEKISLWHKIILVIFGLFLFFVLLEIGLRFGGFLFMSLQERINQASFYKKGYYRIMCLGESTTAWGNNDSYPRQLETILNQRNIGIKFSVINKGVLGTNTTVILKSLEDNLNKYQPDMVTAMMGINDIGEVLSYQGIPSVLGTFDFLRHFRTYKLARLLLLHIAAKAGEAGFYSARMKKNVYVAPESALKQFDGSAQSNREEYDKCLDIGWFNVGQGNYSQAEELFKKAIELIPLKEAAYIDLGDFYRDQGRYFQAEQPLNKAIELNPKSDKAYFSLGRLYAEWGKFSQAEEAYKKSIELNPGNDRPYGALASLHKEAMNQEASGKYYRKANELRLSYYNETTRGNFLKLKEILEKRGIKLVCVQYPVRSVEPLKKIFKGQEGVIFVSNEKVFKVALMASSYKEYFSDIFGGDFGHCTTKGNRLLAENIAGVILKEQFNK